MDNVDLSSEKASFCRVSEVVVLGRGPTTCPKEVKLPSSQSFEKRAVRYVSLYAAGVGCDPPCWCVRIEVLVGPGLGTCDERFDLLPLRLFGEWYRWHKEAETWSRHSAQ